jgi:hypothetical protein
MVLRLKSGLETAARRIRGRANWNELVGIAETMRGEGWEKWKERHGDWGRDALMYVATRHGRIRLSEVVKQTGMKYQAAAQAVKRFGKSLAEDQERERFVSKLKSQMSNI